MTSARLVILCGLPGSGKTTLARQLAEERGGVRLSADEWMEALGGSLWDEDLRARTEALQWALAQDLLRRGCVVIVEWGSWARVERDALRLRARELGAAVELHHLDAPLDELWRRVDARQREDPPITRADFDGWTPHFQVPDAEEQALFDPPPGA